ncbi:hypothetical protein [Rhizobium arsenicireducens]
MENPPPGRVGSLDEKLTGFNSPVQQGLIIAIRRFCGRQAFGVIGGSLATCPLLKLAAHEVLAQLVGRARLALGCRHICMAQALAGVSDARIVPALIRRGRRPSFVAFFIHAAVIAEFPDVRKGH